MMTLKHMTPVNFTAKYDIRLEAMNVQNYIEPWMAYAILLKVPNAKKNLSRYIKEMSKLQIIFNP